MFSFISVNWRGRALTDIRTIVELISNTTTRTGFHHPSRLRSKLNWYPTGVKVTDAEFNALPLEPHDWHGDWNYTLAAA